MHLETSRLRAGLLAAISHARTRMVAEVASGCRLRGRLWVHGGGKLCIGPGALLDGGDVGIELKVERGAQLLIGADVRIGPGTSIEAQESIVIGDGCRIGAHCKILDNHLHALEGDRRARPSSTPILVAHGAWLDDFVVILPRARIGRGARVGRGAVVSRQVGDGATVAAQRVHWARLS